MITKLKTVTAKVLANSLDQPVILIDKNYPNIETFIANLNFKCILFFDEFEKNFGTREDPSSLMGGKTEGGNASILTIMDGVYNCCDRKVFILTTNTLNINSCLLSRPSRIRYKKEFTNISVDILNYLFDKFLEDKEVRDELFTYVTNLEVCSVDIVKSLITEVNIHGKDAFEYIKEIFNVKASPVHYNIYKVYDSYYDYEIGEYVSRNKAECIKLLMEYKDLKDKKLTRTEEENKRITELGSQGCYSENSVYFPAKYYNLKPGMFLQGGTITEVNEDMRMVMTQDSEGTITYVYICPTYTFNMYNGALMI